MLIVLNSNKEIIENYGTNSAFPDGNIPGITPIEGQVFVRIHDNSSIAKQIMNAYQYELVLDGNNICNGVNVTMDKEEYLATLPPSEPEPTQDGYLLDLDFRLSLIELGL